MNKTKSYVDWVPDLPDTDRSVIERTSYGTPADMGRRPVLVLVDFQAAYLGDDLPILQQIERFPSGGGDAAWEALRNSLPVLEAARKNDVPIIFTVVSHTAAAAHTNSFVRKRGNSDAFLEGSPGTKLAAELERRPNETLLTKGSASAFQGTGLYELLTEIGADSVVTCGLSTSGCVRATVVGAAGYGFPVSVVEDASADRISISHRVALFDIWLKYGNVVSSESAASYFARL